MPEPDKFEDCKYCEHRRTDTCEDCEFGEQFEDIEESGLQFDYSDCTRMERVA